MPLRPLGEPSQKPTNTGLKSSIPSDSVASTHTPEPLITPLLQKTRRVQVAAALEASESTALQVSSAAVGGPASATPSLWQKLKRFTGELFSGELGIRSSARSAVSEINELEKDYKALSTEELKGKTEDFRARVKAGESLDDLLPEAFAAAREASRRTIGIRPYDVQLEGAYYAQKGGIVEMKTGEGKTYMGMLATYLHSLKGDGAHVLTYNNYLAQRDAEKASKVMSALGVTVGSIYPDMPPEERKTANQADITYGSAAEFGFQYLRDNLVHYPEDKMGREPTEVFALLDEADSIVLDESRTPLIISDTFQDNEKPTKIFHEVVKHLKEEVDFQTEKSEGKAWLTDAGLGKVEKILGMGELHTPNNEKYLPYLNSALQVRALLEKDVDYMVTNGKVVLIDKLTGRAKPDHRFSEGIHQAIEAAEGLAVGHSSKTIATITHPNYLRKYGRVAGMTGTAVSAKDDFLSLGLSVIDVPTHRPNQRKDLEDRLFATSEERDKALADQVLESHKKGRPILLGTPTIELSETLSRRLTEMGIDHQVLNARNPEVEAQIVAQAGRKGSVTIATNMAGRGTDIKLGGDPEHLAKLESARTGASADLLIGKWKAHCQAEKAKILDLGGLQVLGAGRNESRRIDDQLAGRAGRQGDPGSSQFFLSLEDRLLSMNLEEPPEIKTELRGEEASKWVDKAQQRSEGRNRDTRSQLLQYDTVMNLQRETVYALRETAVDGLEFTQELPEFIERAAKAITSEHFEGSFQKDPLRSRQQASAIARLPLNQVPEFKSAKEMSSWVGDKLEGRLKLRQEAFGPEGFEKTLRTLYLSATDLGWSRQQDTLKHLKDGAWMQSYAQADPIQEYNLQAYQSFEKMLDGVAVQVVQTALQVPTPEEARQQIQSGQAQFQPDTE